MSGKSKTSQNPSGGLRQITSLIRFQKGSKDLAIVAFLVFQTQMLWKILSLSRRDDNAGTIKECNYEVRFIFFVRDKSIDPKIAQDTANISVVT